MNKIILLIFLVFNSNLFAQKFGYVNSEFILNNMKEYKEAISEIESLSKAWEKEISDMYIEIEKKEIELKTEEILLTKQVLKIPESGNQFIKIFNHLAPPYKWNKKKKIRL